MYDKKASKCPDPVASLFRPDSNFGSVTETIDEMIDKYIETESSKPVLPVKGAQAFDPDEFRVTDLTAFKCFSFFFFF